MTTDGSSSVNRTSVLCAALLLSSACASAPKVQVNSEFDRGASFESLRSYDFHVPPDAAPRDERIDAKLINARVQRAVAAQLESRGFVRDFHGTPDFLVAHHILLDSRFEIDSYIDLATYGYRSWTQPMRMQQVIREYDHGVMILDIIDANTKTMIWRGYGEAKVDLEDEEAHKRAEIIRAAVAKILESFPPP